MDENYTVELRDALYHLQENLPLDDKHRAFLYNLVKELYENTVYGHSDNNAGRPKGSGANFDREALNVILKIEGGMLVGEAIEDECKSCIKGGYKSIEKAYQVLNKYLHNDLNGNIKRLKCEILLASLYEH